MFLNPGLRSFGRRSQWLSNAMAKPSSWMNAEQAKEYGLIDKIIEKDVAPEG